jgi:CRP-like cAMP-binding protein
VLVDIYRVDEFFRESALAGPVRRPEKAVAIEPTNLMSWSKEEVEENAMLRPKLALALLQLVVSRSMQFERRIESF